MKDKKSILSIFGVFFKIGLFTFGGGYAMLPVIEHECVERHKWITEDELMDVTVIAESTPGPVAINCATYTGYKRCGIPGAISGTLGVVTPSLIIIFIISVFLDDFLKYKIIANAFRGIKVAVALLIINAAVKMVKQIYKHENARPFSLTVIVAAAITMLIIDIFSINFSVFYMIIIAGIAGYVFYLVTKKGGKQI